MLNQLYICVRLMLSASILVRGGMYFISYTYFFIYSVHWYICQNNGFKVYLNSLYHILLFIILFLLFRFHFFNHWLPKTWEIAWWNWKFMSLVLFKSWRNCYKRSTGKPWLMNLASKVWFLITSNLERRPESIRHLSILEFLELSCCTSLEALSAGLPSISFELFAGLILMINLDGISANYKICLTYQIPNFKNYKE